MRLTAVFMVLLASVAAVANPQITEEKLYQQLMGQVRAGQKALTKSVKASDRKLLVDVLWDVQESEAIPADYSGLLASLRPSDFAPGERLRLNVLRHRMGLNHSPELARQLSERLSGNAGRVGSRNEALPQLIVSLREDLHTMGMSDLVMHAYVTHPVATKAVLTVERPVGDQRTLAQDLWEHEPDLATWSGGRYAEGLRLYMFCRTQRKFSCLYLMRDRQHRPVRNSDGTLWTQTSLAASARDIPSHQRNGNTPAGIHLINGVMPTADQQTSFGKFRRLILDFVPASTGEARQKELLPASSKEASWWQPNVVARNVGRNLFRIHGTGKLNLEPTAPWFPFMRTSGCIASRENTYGGVEYRDQQHLLNTAMSAMALTPAYENETAIKGVLFVIEIDDEAKAVTLNDLREMGIR
jgi:hypothetical protein